MTLRDDEDMAPDVQDTDQGSGDEAADQIEDNSDPASAAPEAEATEEVIISLGDPPADAGEPDAGKPKESSVITKLRQKLRDADRQLREAKLEKEAQAKATDAPQLGPKPKLEDFDYDPDKLVDAMEAWVLRKREVEDHQRKAREAQEAEAKAFEAKRKKYRQDLEALPVRDAEEVHEQVAGTLSPIQQGIILHIAADPAKLVYALGKSPADLDRLSKLTDHLQLAAEIARLESKVMTTKRTPAAPTPEKRLSGVGSAAGATDRKLEQLRKDAERTGDFSEVMRYKRSLKAAAAK